MYRSDKTEYHQLYDGNIIFSDFKELCMYRLDKNEYHYLYDDNTISSDENKIFSDAFQHQSLRSIYSFFLESQRQLRSFSILISYL